MPGPGPERTAARMQRSEVDSEIVARLAGLRARDGLVLSVYLELDPAEPLSSRRTRLASLLSDVERRHLRDGKLPRRSRRALAADIKRARDHLERERLAQPSARAVALFASGPADLFESYGLPRRVESQAAVEDSPFIEPLIEMLRPDAWAVLLVNRRTARLLRGSPEVLVEARRFEDDLHRRHHQGGWSQARFARGIEKQVDDHLKHAAAALFASHRRSGVAHLVLGGQVQVLSRIEDELHPYLRSRLAGRIDVDVERSAPEDVLAAAQPVMEDVERSRERGALDRLKNALGSPGRAAVGIEEVLAELQERRVEALLVEEGFHTPGVVCTRCGWVAGEGEACRLDGAPTDPRPDVIENAIQLALGQGAEVVTVRHHPMLEPHGRVAALLRY